MMTKPGIRHFSIIALFAAQTAVATTEVSFLMVYSPDHPEEPATARLLEYAQAHPDVELVKWGGLTLPGGGGRAPFMLAMAGGSAPDIYRAWFHILRHDVEQGFCAPLDEWVKPGDPDEWPGWKEVPELWKQVATEGGHVWAIPEPGVAYYGIVYRKDLVAAAGLDPENPPATWAEFREWCRALTFRDRAVAGARLHRGQRAFAIENRPWGFLPWVQAAGGDVIRPRADGTGFEACFACPAAIRAADFLESLIADGSVRPLAQLSSQDDAAELFALGEIVAVFGGESLVKRLTTTLDFPPGLIGIMPFPAADSSCRRVLQAHRHFYAMTEGVARRPKAERDRVWECLETLCSASTRDAATRRDVAEGRARWCLPADLERLGLSSYLAEIPEGIRRMYADLEKGDIVAVTEPWAGFWQGASDLMGRRFLGILLSDAGRKFDRRAALASITADANRGLMFDADRSRIDRARPTARVIAGALAISLVVALWMVLGARRRKECAAAEPRRFRFAPAFFLAPAVLSIALWSYYPLVKGALMAFQDYRIVGAGSWVGLDNFIRVTLDPGFWASWARTLEYVLVTLALGFTAPVLLAIMLSEIPKGRIFFRTVYFLPHLTSALVVTLLWKTMFDPTENGMINRALALFGIARHAWLQDPAWAMTCCILPGVWMGAGMSSLIYIAALSSLPQDYYEAAAIDGAGIFSRLRHITLPQLAPLMVINFVGAFIAAFQGMGSIFLLTFGGPGDATNVLSLAIWKEAYNNLRFSSATAMAWYLGTVLVAFTCLEIKFLRKVEFRQAAAN